MTYLCFEARAAHRSKPFISGTGYRSFLGCSATPEVDMTPATFVMRVIAHHVETALGGKLIAIA